MTSRTDIRAVRAVILVVASLGVLGTTGGRAGAVDTASLRSSGSQHLPTAPSVTPNSDPAETPTDSAPVDSTPQSTTPSDSTPDDTTPDDAPTQTDGNSDKSTDPLTAALALAGFVILLGIAAWWMVRHQSPDEQPYPRPTDDAGEFPDGML